MRFSFQGQFSLDKVVGVLIDLISETLYHLQLLYPFGNDMLLPHGIIVNSTSVRTSEGSLRRSEGVKGAERETRCLVWSPIFQ